MILIDSSAWSEFLRDTGSIVSTKIDVALDGDFAGCDAIRMEILAGARSEQHLNERRSLLAMTVVLPTDPADYEVAATLFRRCRSQGETVRRLIDCLIAAVAIRHNVPVLHNDQDFGVLASYTELQIA